MREDLTRVGLSTHWNATRCADLGAAIDEIVDLGVGLVEIGLPETPVDLGGAAEALERHRARCHALTLVRPEVERFLVPHLLQVDVQLRERAERHLERAVAGAARLRAPRVALRLGSLPVEFEEERLAALESSLAGGDSEATAELVAQLRTGREGRREAACESLCRRLHALGRRHPGLELVMLPSADPLALPDLEECGWLLDELPRLLRLRLDLGELGLREALGLDRLEDWIDRHESRADAVYLCDFHGFKTDLPPGAGRLGPAIERLELSPRLPTILKLDPASSRLTVEEALRRQR